MHSNSNSPVGVDVLSHLLSLVGQAVLLPIPLGKKGPTIRGWEKVTYSDTQEDSYQRKLIEAVQLGGNIGVSLGVGSGRLLAFDVDSDELVEQCHRRCSWLAQTLTSRGKRGCQFWLRLEEDCDYPSAKAVVTVKGADGSKLGELRFGGSAGAQSVIFGVHPDGPCYQITNPVRPLVIGLADLYELTGWVPEQQRKEERTPAPTDEPKLELTPELVTRLNYFVDHCVPAIERDGGDNRTYAVSCTLWHDYGLSVEQAWPFLKRYNRRCKPPWKEKDLWRKLEQAAEDTHHRGHRGQLLQQAMSGRIADDDPKAPPYLPTGNSPVGYLSRGICDSDILLGEGFLERGSAALLAGPSGIGKSSIAMQMGCCWSCGRRAFDFVPPRPMRIVMMQNEDSPNDLVRQSEALRFLELDQKLIRQNFWIETVRGKIGPDAVKVMEELVQWHRADLLFLNPISAYHDGDISQNKDNVKFLYGSIGKLLAEFRIGLFGFHHKGKPPKDKGKSHSEDVYFQVMYDILGGSVLTNFFRGIITVSPIGNSGVFGFTVAKRFEESGWPLHSAFYRWHEDRNRRLWVPASVAEVDGAKKASGKNIEDLRRLVPVTGVIPREVLENEAAKSGFKQREYRALITEACADSTPDDLRIYEWTFYNPKGPPKVAYSRSEQPSDQTAQAVKEAERSRRRQSSSKIQSSSMADDNCDSN